jgi:hypothetical protein
MSAPRTDLQVLFYGFPPDDLTAGITLLPQPLSLDVLFAIARGAALHRGLLSIEPGHCKISHYSNMAACFPDLCRIKSDGSGRFVPEEEDNFDKENDHDH